MSWGQRFEVTNYQAYDISESCSRCCTEAAAAAAAAAAAVATAGAAVPPPV